MAGRVYPDMVVVNEKNAVSYGNADKHCTPNYDTCQLSCVTF
jgi:hypothetical protein